MELHSLLTPRPLKGEKGVSLGQAGRQAKAWIREADWVAKFEEVGTLEGTTFYSLWTAVRL